MMGRLKSDQVRYCSTSFILATRFQRIIFWRERSMLLSISPGLVANFHPRP
jgi:hypothetical protein